MSNTDNRTSVDSGALTMALNVLRRAGKNEVADALEQTADRAHIEAMQRDCRTCVLLVAVADRCMTNISVECSAAEPCANHNQWTPVEFKQLTRSE